MKEDDYLMISRYLDDELDEQERNAFSLRLEQDDEFAKMFASLSEQHQLLSSAGTEIDQEPMPDNVMALLNQDTSNDAGGEPSGKSWGHFLPLAATLTLMLLSAPILIDLVGDPNASDVQVQHWQKALEEQPSNQLLSLDDEVGSKIQISLTFLHQDGRYCREFYVSQPDVTTQGVACRTDAEWTLEMEGESSAVLSSEYFVPASTGDNPAVSEYIDANLAADPLGNEEETQLIAQGWSQ